jgi:hypothetical protein
LSSHTLYSTRATGGKVIPPDPDRIISEQDKSMKLKSLSLAMATTALVAFSLPAMAQDKTGTNTSTEGGGEQGGAATLSMAHELYAIGVASGDALTVLTAAKLAATVDLKDGGEIKLETSGDEVADGDEGASEDPAEAAEMFAMAVTLAGDDEALKGIIEDAAAESSRGRVGGAVRWISTAIPMPKSPCWAMATAISTLR